jgi:hypothetical protein
LSKKETDTDRFIDEKPTLEPIETVKKGDEDFIMG